MMPGDVPLHVAAVQRLTCDSELGRVLFGPGGEILDLGRSTRFPSTAQRRALVIRDGGCVFPGCDRPPQHCDAHHLVFWSTGGSTDRRHLALVCAFHHTLVHEHGWALAPTDDGRLGGHLP